ncbi:MAG: hypothetical protein QOD58_3869 [Mycobacterium sp.]|nr:hypothetical protein [Mycobacterium sp.]
MSFVLAAPDAVIAAASDIGGIGSSISAANAAAAVPTTGVLAAAADEVSAQIAALFSTHGEGYQKLSAQLATFHDQFALALNSGASQYAAAEASAVQNLVSAVNAPAEKLLGQSIIGSGSAAGGNVVSNAIGGFQSIFQASGGPGALGSRIAAATSAVTNALQALPTGAARAVTAASALLQSAGVTGVAGAAAALPAAAFGDGIKSLYLAIEPWVAYGFDLASYAAGWVPWIGWIVAPQIQFFYNWIEPMVQSGLFNILDWLGGSISFSQGLNNFLNVAWNETWQFFYDEFYWVFGSILPPLPPLPPWPF